MTEAMVRSNIPIPDPTEITSREIAKLREQLQREFGADLSSAADLAQSKRETSDVLTTALATRVEHVAAKAVADAVELAGRFSDKLDALRLLTDERFEGLKIAFREDKIAAATAVAAAFAAQEKLSVAQNLSNTAAITKSEGSTTKELESLDEKIGTLKDSFASDIRNLEGRMNRGEGGQAGVREMRSEHRADATQILLACGVVVSLLLGVTGIVLDHLPAAAPSQPAAASFSPR